MRRRGVTLVELAVGLGILAVLATLSFQLQRTGWRRVQSTENKLTASRITHEQAEALRRTLATATWAWVVPPAKGESSSHLMYVGRTVKRKPGDESRRPEHVIEHYLAEDEHRLVVDGRPGRAALADARFEPLAPHVVAFTLHADEHNPATGMNAARESSTLSSAAYLATEREDQEYARFAFEEDHPWCTHGKALHYGFVDP